MHPHLHTKHNGVTAKAFDETACEELMNALDECHAKGFLWKVMGMCNDDKNALNRCLREQRLLRTKANREAAKIKNKKIREQWADIDANS